MAIPIKATPRVPIVPQEVPVAREVRLQTKQAVNRKYLGEISFKP
jgi:hypothetical protein